MLFLGLVGVEAGATQGRSQCGGMDGDDRPQARLIVGAENDLLVAIAIDVLEHTHVVFVSLESTRHCVYRWEPSYRRKVAG